VTGPRRGANGMGLLQSFSGHLAADLTELDKEIASQQVALGQIATPRVLF
jgi:hypothetical protein